MFIKQLSETAILSIVSCLKDCSDNHNAHFLQSVAIENNHVNVSCYSGGILFASHYRVLSQNTLDGGEFLIDQELVDMLLNQSGSILVRGEQITFANGIKINSEKDFTFAATKNIHFNKGGEILKTGAGNLYLKAGIESDSGTVVFDAKKKFIKIEDGGKVIINYHPEVKTASASQHKYYNPKSYFQYVEPATSVASYMMVSNIQDLQDITKFLHGNYALAKDIDASSTKDWNNGEGFKSIMKISSNNKNPVPFSGNFDGNEYKIHNLFVKTNQDFVGLFGSIQGNSRNSKLVIKNFVLENSEFEGDHYIGSVAGQSTNAHFINIKVNNVMVKGVDVYGGLVGTASGVEIESDVSILNLNINCQKDLKAAGLYAGAIRDSYLHIQDASEICELLGRDYNNIHIE